EVQPILEPTEPPGPEPAVSPDLPLQASAENRPILEQEEPAEPEPAVSRYVYTARKDDSLHTAKYDDAIKLDPKFAVTYENRTFTKSKKGRGSIGVTIRRVTDGAAHTLNVKPARGGLVVELDENGTAKTAGIEPAAAHVKGNGKDVKECRDLPCIVADTPPGKEVVITIIRNGKEITKTVRVGCLEDGDDQQPEFNSQNGTAKPVAVDLMSEATAKHLEPGMAIVE